MSSSPSRIYKRLPDDTIRVLILKSGEPNDPLRGSFKLQRFPHGRIEVDALPYEALSYTWGAPGFPERITFASSEIPITQNLFDALIRIRDTKEPREVWIDALCINQQDKNEKSQQIPLM